MPFPPRYTPEHIHWLKEHVPHQPHKDSREQFERVFGLPLSDGQLKGLVKRHAAMKGASVNRGRVPWNKGKGKPKPPRRKEMGPVGKPMFSERVDRGGKGRRPQILIKVPGPSPVKTWRNKPGQKRSHWVRKAVWIWEKSNGPVPEGSCVIHLDGDWRNCDLGNLRCVTKEVMGCLVTQIAPLATGNVEVDTARLQLAELRASINAAEKGGP